MDIVALADRHPILAVLAVLVWLWMDDRRKRLDHPGPRKADRRPHRRRYASSPGR